MKDLNAFITEILTVDYSHFRGQMEVILSMNETTTQISEKSRSVETHREAVEFGSFLKTEMGRDYAKEFTVPSYPTTFSVNVLQHAITDLLNLPQEQLQAQINRLFKLLVFWSHDGQIRAEYSPLHQAKNDVEGVRLHILNQWFEENGIITRNIPIPGLNYRIFLRKHFYDNFDWFANNKLHTLDYLIKEIGVSPAWKGKYIWQDLNPLTGSGQSVVFITNDYRTILIADLSSYIDEENLDNLSNLINGETIVSPIIVNCQQNTLGKIFYKAYTNHCTQSSKKAFAKWICEHFQRQIDGQIHKLTESTMQNHLKGLGFD